MAQNIGKIFALFQGNGFKSSEFKQGEKRSDDVLQIAIGIGKKAGKEKAGAFFEFTQHIFHLFGYSNGFSFYFCGSYFLCEALKDSIKGIPQNQAIGGLEWPLFR